MDKEIQFPLTYDLRIIYKGDSLDGITKISNLLKDLTIIFKKGVLKPGGKGDLSRIGFNITLISKDQMTTMYNNLNTIPEVKWAT